MKHANIFLILDGARHNAYQNDPYAKEFGIKISEKLASVEARILPAPWVTYPNSSIAELRLLSKFQNVKLYV